MSPGDAILRRIRTAAARLLLYAFVVAAQFAPVAHLATHRPDHTHGPRPEVLDEDDHEAAHESGQPHDHDDTGSPPGSRWPNASSSGRPVAHTDGAAHDDRDSAPRAPRSPGPPGGDHGRDSTAHFGVALTEGPPAPILPPPAAAIAPPPDRVPGRHDAPVRPHPPVRGPPV